MNQPVLLTSAQNQIAADLHRFRVINCGRRFGKTTLAVEEIKGKVLTAPRKVAYIAPTYQQARDIAWEMLKRELQPIITSINESRLEIRTRTMKGGESIVYLRGWEAIETLRGQFFHFVVIDEVASMRNWWTRWDEVIRPTLTDTRGEVMFISTPRGYNHFYDLYNREHEDKDYKSFHFTTYDNPHVPWDEIEKAKKELPENRFAQEYLADFKKTEGLVYKEFIRERHVQKKPLVNIVDRIVPVDFGFTNPAAMLVIEKDTDAHYWVTTEYYKTGKTTAELIEYAKSLKANKFYPDPAEPDRIEEMRRANLNVREVSKDIEAGINAVRELFKTDRIRIDPSCINLIAELETYRYPEKKPERNEPEVPVKEDDHLVDCLRYALYMQEPAGEPAPKAKVFRPKFSPRNPMPRHQIDR